MDRSVPSTAGSAFVRDRPTVLNYAALGMYGFWLYVFGPAVSLLRADLHFSYTIIGGYSAAWAVGSVAAGAVFARLTGWLGRNTLLWSSAAAATAGAGLFALTGTVAATMAGGVLLGLAGTLLQTTTQSVLSDRHGPRRDRALTESNIGAAACAVLAPVALAGLHHTSFGWRSAFVVPAVVLAVLYVIYRHVRLPEAPTPAPFEERGRHGLSLACWLLCVLVAVGIGVEFALIYFAAELLTTNTGLPIASAAALVTVYYVGILAGRIVGARLTRVPGRTRTLLWVSLGLTLAGLLLVWLVPITPLAVIGLLVAGLGIANQFPLALALALSAAGPDTDTANARTQLLGGVLLLTAPFLLGALADHIGRTLAFAVPVVLTAASGFLLLVGTHRTQTTH